MKSRTNPLITFTFSLAFIFMVSVCMSKIVVPGTAEETAINMNDVQLIGSCNISEGAESVQVVGNYAYILDGSGIFRIIDISDSSSPAEIGSIDTLPNGARKVRVSGEYAYALDKNGDKLRIVDISNPSSPTEIGNYQETFMGGELAVLGNYVYVPGNLNQEVTIIDVSNPQAPFKAGSYESKLADFTWDIKISGHYAFLETNAHLIDIIDLSNPVSPVSVGHSLYGGIMQPHIAYQVNGDYLYKAVLSCLAGYCSHTFSIEDTSDPADVQSLGSYDIPEDDFGIVRVFVFDGYAFCAHSTFGVRVVDVSDLSSPREAGTFNTPGDAGDVFVYGGCVYVADRSYGLKIYQMPFPFPSYPFITLSRRELYFGVSRDGLATGAQDLFIENSGGGTLNWTATSSPGWFNISPSSGTGEGKLSVSIDAAGLTAGTYTGSITISDANASNSPTAVDVTLKVYGSGNSASAPPFGFFATPVDGSTVQGSVPVTGWALDDIGVESVKIYREPLAGEGPGLLYIGDASFVEGARPDVETAYPGYPLNSKAGWGYMMLSYFLPDEGNRTFILHAIAIDKEGNQVTLGTKTITGDNANAVKPFGAIDTPTQGGEASGTAFINWGWVLTPQPNSIPTDGSTINVIVDGIHLGHPVYNNYRPDIANLFPGYVNSSGAVGYFYLDTTAYENGVHTIQWAAADNAGNTDGIGSRYFTVQNTAGSGAQRTAQRARRECRGGHLPPPISGGTIPIDYSTPVSVKKGYNPDTEPQIIFPGHNGIITIEIKELQRLEIHFPDSRGPTLNRSPLPIGSTLDAAGGVFSWSPGPGFSGTYELIFIDYNKNCLRRININILPKHSLKVKKDRKLF